MNKNFCKIKKVKLSCGVLGITSPGFITLFSIIILAGVAMVLVGFLFGQSLWATKSSLEELGSAKARSSANACAETALQTIKDSNSFVGTGNLTINAVNCSYTVSNTGGNNRSITVIAGSGNEAIRKINITTDAFSPKLHISGWQETP